MPPPSLPVGAGASANDVLALQRAVEQVQQHIKEQAQAIDDIRNDLGQIRSGQERFEALLTSIANSTVTLSNQRSRSLGPHYASSVNKDVPGLSEDARPLGMPASYVFMGRSRPRENHS